MRLLIDWSGTVRSLNCFYHDAAAYVLQPVEKIPTSFDLLKESLAQSGAVPHFPGLHVTCDIVDGRISMISPSPSSSSYHSLLAFRSTLSELVMHHLAVSCAANGIQPERCRSVVFDLEKEPSAKSHEPDHAIPIRVSPARSPKVGQSGQSLT
jgi:hypothetical protein